MPYNLSDPTAVRQQFQTTSNLDSRRGLHVQFSQNKYGWFPWVFDQFKLHNKTQILELGCGTGDLWWENQHRLSSEWHLTVTDLFPNMVNKTKETLLKLPQPLRLEYLVTDIQAISFKDAQFDVVIALHVLYFVQDRKTAYQEIERVLKPQGQFFASSMGKTNLQELWELIDKFDPQTEQWLNKRPIIHHTLETEAKELTAWFSEVKVHRYDDALLITKAEPLIEYIRSTADKAVFNCERFEEFAEFIKEELGTQGTIRITKDYGVLECSR